MWVNVLGEVGLLTKAVTTVKAAEGLLTWVAYQLPPIPQSLLVLGPDVGFSAVRTLW